MVMGNTTGGVPLVNMTGQTAPKAKKPPVAFNEEDLAQSEFMTDDDWMNKIEAEWQQNKINRMIARDEAMAREARFAITAKGPLFSDEGGSKHSVDPAQ